MLKLRNPWRFTRKMKTFDWRQMVMIFVGGFVAASFFNHLKWPWFLLIGVTLGIVTDVILDTWDHRNEDDELSSSALAMQFKESVKTYWAIKDTIDVLVETLPEEEATLKEFYSLLSTEEKKKLAHLLPPKLK